MPKVVSSCLGRFCELFWEPNTIVLGENSEIEVTTTKKYVLSCSQCHSKVSRAALNTQKLRVLLGSRTSKAQRFQRSPRSKQFIYFSPFHSNFRCNLEICLNVFNEEPNPTAIELGESLWRSKK
eukprot:c26633_g1_i1.p1 GENE.c26633_g1_i1~~c26633_g1_i1.p1  ORF type:complete len:124 (+),score=7.64 c26633_g1_i1:47-418(+)